MTHSTGHRTVTSGHAAAPPHRRAGWAAGRRAAGRRAAGRRAVPALAALLAVLVGDAAAAPVFAAETPPGRETILALAGCFEVTYRFYEDGKHDYFNPEYGLDAPIRERVGIVDEAPDRITLQHFSFNRAGEAVAHWHEEWRHEAAGWRQTVYSRTPDHPDRERRYGCTAPWSANRWHCRAGPAPKPFRDDGAPFGFDREDYETLDRSNTILVTPEGWVQSQANRKIDAGGRLVSHELGFIVYERLADAACGTESDTESDTGDD